MNLMVPPSIGELYEWLGKGGQPVSLANQGEICLVHKAGLPVTRDDTNKRPISILNEIATKLQNGILAARITTSLHSHPQLLD